MKLPPRPNPMTKYLHNSYFCVSKDFALNISVWQLWDALKENLGSYAHLSLVLLRLSWCFVGPLSRVLLYCHWGQTLIDRHTLSNRLILCCHCQMGGSVFRATQTDKWGWNISESWNEVNPNLILKTVQLSCLALCGQSSVWLCYCILLLFVVVGEHRVFPHPPYTHNASWINWFRWFILWRRGPSEGQTFVNGPCRQYWMCCAVYSGLCYATSA